MRDSRNPVADVAALLVVAGLLAAVYLLPPDTSLAEVRETGLLRACIPPSYPPLVIDDDDHPGFEVEFLEAIASELDLRIGFGVNPAIGSDFNPRNWRVTRAQCQIIAGGVVATTLTRSFLETTTPHLETGWVIVTDDDFGPMDGQPVGVFVGLSGRDRITLGRTLREVGANITVVQSAAELSDGIRSGEFSFGVTDAFAGAGIAESNGWQVAWLPVGERDPVAFGLWKGDLTLKRAIEAAINTLQADGTIDRLREEYNVNAVTETYEW